MSGAEMQAPDLAEMTRARCAHLTPVELRLAQERLGLGPEAIDGPPVGLVVGEAPRHRGRGTVALFPWPATSSSARLVSWSEIGAGAWLGRLYRTNLLEDGSQSMTYARKRADQIREWLVGLGTMRVLLLGRRVGEAFGLTDFFEKREEFHPASEARATYMTIPHPSGRNTIYNNLTARNNAKGAVLWAAGFAT